MAIVITLGAYELLPPDQTDQYEARFKGWKSGLSDRELWLNNRGRWELGKRAESERYVLLVAGRAVYPGSLVVLAAEISRLFAQVGDGPRDPDGRRTIDGTVLSAGHPVYDAYVGKPSPLVHTYGYVHYLDSPFDQA